MRRHAAVVTVLLLAGLARAADDPPNPFRDVPAERNGWALLVEACGLVTRDESVPLMPPFGYPDPWHPQRPGVLRHLEVNAPALARLDEAMARPELEPPSAWADGHATGDPFFTVIPHLRELARLKIQRAYLRRAQGDMPGALRDIDDLLRLSAKRSASGGDLTDYLVTAAVDDMAQAALITLLGPPLALLDVAILDPTQVWPVSPLGPAATRTLLDIQMRLTDERDCFPSFARALAGEQEGLRRALYRPTFYEGPQPSAALIEQVLAYRRVVRLAVLAAARQPAWTRAPRPASTLPAPTALLSGAPWADLYMLAGGHEDRWASQVDRAQARRRLTATAIAVWRYAARHERLPGSLADLVADGLLPAVPIDPFDGQPLRYRPRRALLYSVDGNQRDDQGQRGLDQLRRLDFVIAADPWRAMPYDPTSSGPPEPGDDEWRQRKQSERGRAALR